LEPHGPLDAIDAGAQPLRVAVVVARLEGGAGMLALKGATVLDPARFTVTVVVGSGGELIARARDAGLEVLVEPSLVAPIAPVKDRRAYLRLRALFEERSFDVVHTHCSKAGALGRLAAHRAGTSAIIHTYHGFAFHQFQSAPRRSAYVRIERHLGRMTDVALCVGNGVAVEALRRRLLSPQRIRTIGVAISDDAAAAASLGAWDAAARRRARDALGLPQDSTVIGAVGRLTYQKAPEDFVAAIDRLGRPDVVGVWIGDGELAGVVERLAGRLRAGRVVLAGERHDVLDLLPAFDCFALPSRYEGLPTALVEAMVCGVPVVATAVNAVPDLVVHGQTGLLVPPLRPDLLAAALRQILDEPTEATRMAANARVHVGDRFTERALREVLSSTYAAAYEQSHSQVPIPS
jgi:glycosyltransferase involved in cell wall biosynthesis